MRNVSKFIIIRNDLKQERFAIATETLLVGRLHECELVLNHPAVSRLHIGIKQTTEDEYFFFNLRPSNPVMLNSRHTDENEMLASGDVIAIGPFFLTIDRGDHELLVRVSMQTGRVHVEEDAGSPDLLTKELQPLEEKDKEVKKPVHRLPRELPVIQQKALDFYWDKRITAATKLVRPAPLFPKSERPTGKAQFIWGPTSDLARLSPVLLIALIVIAVLLITCGYWFPR